MNQRNRTITIYNLNITDLDQLTADKWQMPVIKSDNIIPDNLIGFNYAINKKNPNGGVHFFLDDYQFERVWRKPQAYINCFKKYDCILTPDFSLYLNMPLPMQVWNVYRSRLLGQYYHNQGIRVIPTLSWGDTNTFEFCFKGIEQGGIVAVSTIGCIRGKKASTIWKNGIDEAIRQIQPSTILIYGNKIEHDYKGVNIINYASDSDKRFIKKVVE